MRCHSNAVLVRSNAVNHNHPTLWSTMCLTIRCDQQALINYLFIYILACTDDEKQRLALELGRSERKKYFNRHFRNRVHIHNRNIEFLKSIEMSSVLRKPAYSKTIAQITMQLISTFCFHNIDSIFPLLSKLFQAS